MLGPKTARVFIRRRKHDENPADKKEQKEITFTLDMLESLLSLRQVDAAKHLVSFFSGSRIS